MAGSLNKSFSQPIATIPADPTGQRSIYITAMVVTTALTTSDSAISYAAGIYPYNPDGWIQVTSGQPLTVSAGAGMWNWCYS